MCGTDYSVVTSALFVSTVLVQRQQYSAGTLVLQSCISIFQCLCSSSTLQKSFEDMLKQKVWYKKALIYFLSETKKTHCRLICFFVDFFLMLLLLLLFFNLSTELNNCHPDVAIFQWDLHLYLSDHFVKFGKGLQNLTTNTSLQSLPTHAQALQV